MMARDQYLVDVVVWEEEDDEERQEEEAIHLECSSNGDKEAGKVWTEAEYQICIRRKRQYGNDN